MKTKTTHPDEESGSPNFFTTFAARTQVSATKKLEGGSTSSHSVAALARDSGEAIC